MEIHGSCAAGLRLKWMNWCARPVLKNWRWRSTGGGFLQCPWRAASNMSFWKAAKTSALLSFLWLIVYGATNWLSSIRQNVGTLYFEWERHIPFVPWMIIPYMSIDLFFITAPFLCRSDEELRTLRNRITFGILLAGACFLLFPLRFAFDRPPASGWLGVVFDAFRSMDKPFNLLPSLHITLRTIL